MRFLLSAILFVHTVSYAQRPPVTDYPQGYFKNPLNVPIQLSGNFGELRPNHYHMGLDLKTLARENLPVHAAADGYISRIKIEPAGFGRAIYITHPNGYTTLYAHLNDFNPQIEAWVRAQQYKQQTWNLLLELTPDLFPVKQGQFIAFSGNTGGSQAPHVHFEIRKTETDVNLNPMLFGFDIADNTKPSILRLGIYDRNKSVYEQSPRIIPVKAAGAGNYLTTPALVSVSSPRVSFAVTSFDTQSGSSNLNGNFQGTIYLDEKPVIEYRMDNISYNDTRYLNAHIDYRLKSSGGAYLQHLSELPGYVNSIYKPISGDGIIDLSDGEEHSIRIEIIDADKNMSVLKTKVKYSGVAQIAETVLSGTVGKMFYPIMLDGFESEECEFFIGEKCLYDRVNIRYSKGVNQPGAVSATHNIGTATIPLQEAFLIRIKPTRALNELEQSRTIMAWVAGGRNGVMKVEWKDGFASAGFRDFGSYRLVVDTEAPEVVPIGFVDGSNLSKASRIAFTIKDNYGKFKNVRPELDGQWLRFTNDKGRTFIYNFDDKCPRGEHELKIYAEDEAGNSTVRSFKFTR
ncbi:MAG: M23 family metallopeptidase [Chitinophagaceae bacterium]|nr:MAG: M23 family metallopeptidase [Chitinophagaceae bacterium]